MTALAFTKDALAKLERVRPVELDEGLVVHVRLLPGSELARLGRLQQLPDQHQLIHLSALFLSDEQGGAVADAELLAELRSWPARWLVKVLDAGNDLNGLGDPEA